MRGVTRQSTTARITLLAAGVAGLALLAAACGGAASRPAPPDDPAETPRVVEPPAAAKPANQPEVVEEPASPPAEPEEAAVALEPPRDREPPGPSAETLALIEEAGQGFPEPGQITIVLDPGHGGEGNTGAVGNGVAESQTNLDISLRVEGILRANGYHVVLTRRDPSRSFLDPRRGLNISVGWRSNRPDLHGRTELARLTNAAVFVSIHSNGHPDPSVNGVEAWYHPSIYGDGANRELGVTIIGHVLHELGAYGYASRSLGAKDDTCWRQFGTRCAPLYVLSPPVILHRDEVVAAGHDPVLAGFEESRDTIFIRGTPMPAVLMELLFISNAQDAAALRDPAGRQAIARGVASGIMQYLRERESAVAEARAGAAEARS